MHKGTPYWEHERCAYFVGELREYSGERQRIVEFYINQERESPFAENMYVVFLEDGSFTKSIPAEDISRNENAVSAAEYAISYHWRLAPSDLEDELYIVYFAYIGGKLDSTCF
jgi:hypothetical protein